MLENFDTFSRQFFLPPKPRMQQSIRLSLGENEDDNDKRRSLPSSLAVDRSGYGNRDKRRSVPSYPCAERSENINGSGVVCLLLNFRVDHVFLVSRCHSAITLAT